MYQLLEELLPRALVDDALLSQLGLALSLTLSLLLARGRRIASREERGNYPGTQRKTPSVQREIDGKEDESPPFESLSDRLVASRRGLLGRLKELFGGETTFDDDTREELEALLISSDVGVQTTQKLIDHLESRFSDKTALTFREVISALHEHVRNILLAVEPKGDVLGRFTSEEGSPRVVMMIGVNGAGKTTTSAKLAKKLSDEGKKVLLVAGDTFRAAAVAQLQEWGRRLSLPVFAGEENAKPSTVVYQAVEEAKRTNVDVVLVDTAGRLHNRKNLMEEVTGIRNAIKKQLGRDTDETFLVLDGTSGQNALTQAREFNSVAPLTGIIITKLDGTPKGGVVVAVADELTVPLLYIGVGEKVIDLRAFKASEFADALLADASGTAKPQLLSAQVGNG